MSSQTNPLPASPSPVESPGRDRVGTPLIRNASELNHFAPLVQKLIHSRQQRPGGLITTYVGVSSGHGVSSVVETLAWMLARAGDEAVLVASPRALSEDVRAPLRAAEPFHPNRVWRLSNREGGDPNTGKPWESLRMIRERFGYVLVDCPPLSESPEVFSSAEGSDGLILVVAAGQSTAHEVKEAQRLLSATAAPFLGIILNKQKEAIPEALSRFL